MNLYLKPFEVEDVATLEKWFYSGDYDDHFRDMTLLTREQLKIYSYMKDGQAFIVRENNDVIGLVTIYEMRVIPSNFKLSVLIDKSYQGKGFCLDSMLLILDYAFLKLGYDKAIVEVLESNERLNNMILKGGFEFEAKLEREAKINGEFQDVIRYKMFKDKYRKIRGSHV